jgi:hypothetical protein
MLTQTSRKTKKVKKKHLFSCSTRPAVPFFGNICSYQEFIYNEMKGKS